MIDWKYPPELPPDMELVIIEFKGYMNGRNGGISDEYCYAGEWFNLPEEVEVLRWSYIDEIEEK